MKKEGKTFTYALFTLGCRVNQYESDAIGELLRGEGFLPAPRGEAADVYVINTCAVTAESERKSRQLIRRARAANPAAVVIAAGCSAELEGAALSDLGADAVCGNAAKTEIPALARRLIAEKIKTAVIVPDLTSAPYDGLSVSEPKRARTYIKIEDGCSNRCAYCVISRVRGPVRSRDPDEVLREAEILLKNGVKEIILTGIETGSYGEDLGDRGGLVRLLYRLDALGVPRIGMGSLDPSVMKDDFIEAAATLPSVLPHFHVSVQSGSSATLRRMRRKYSAERLRDRLSALRNAVPDVTLSADVITGFPGETDAEFDETLALMSEIRFLHLHVFPYSSRPGTEAAGMADQVPAAIRKERAAELSRRQTVIKSELLARYVRDHASSPVAVLVEKCSGGKSSGHSEHWVDVSFPGSPSDAGQILRVFTVSSDGKGILGETK
ncbi:MAG: tRNA (N(6)-L-threonylcarbamoyladenosine(37)-C(2))-methylthiotransferase MtaB [Clostridia bacterium]|nr:tRNA (N(6)-L-threonylcarbamoyladenosine(37)-C(2))-methylthiotransferase MtaB [Clostridia bacterium]